MTLWFPLDFCFWFLVLSVYIFVFLYVFNGLNWFYFSDPETCIKIITVVKIYFTHINEVGLQAMYPGVDRQFLQVEVWAGLAVRTPGLYLVTLEGTRRHRHWRQGARRRRTLTRKENIISFLYLHQSYQRIRKRRQRLFFFADILWLLLSILYLLKI